MKTKEVIEAFTDLANELKAYNKEARSYKSTDLMDLGEIDGIAFVLKKLNRVIKKVTA